MPRYTLPSGVVVECSEETAGRIAGATSAGGSSSSTPRKRPGRKPKAEATEKPSDSSDE